MATSEVEIVNSALIKLGEATISDLSEDRKAARKAKRQYPIVRAKLLRSYRWNFAITRSETLGPSSPGPKFGFLYRFQLPVDCIRVLGIFSENEPVENYTSATTPFKVEGRNIFCDEIAIKIFYIADVTNPDLFDPMFSEVLACALAVELGYDLSAGMSRIDQLKEELKDAKKEARGSNAIEGTPEVIIASDWTDARYNRGPLRIGPVV